MLRRLAMNNDNVVKGTCFEIRSAAHLKETQGMVLEATNTTMGRTSSDLVDNLGNIYQCKSGAHPSLKDVQKWCAAAKDASCAADFSKVKWVVPSEDMIPSGTLAWLKKKGIDRIVVPFEW